MKRSQFWMILVSHCVLLVALALSLYWNVVQAREKSAQCQFAYTEGQIAGLEFAAAIMGLKSLKQQRESRFIPFDDHL